VRGLDWQPLQLPLAAGLNQKVDERALPPPELAEAIDVQFDELGGLQTRKPFTAIGSTIAGGGTISTARRLYANGNELVMFTKDSVYSWNDQLDRWVFRATHLAVATEERTAYATPGDQYDCDRAELTGMVFHAWCDSDAVYMAVTDKASGAAVLAPTAVAGQATRPRLVALSTKVLLFWQNGTDAVPGAIRVMAFDPTATDPATWSSTLSGAGTIVLAAASSGSYYDVTRLLTTDTAIFVGRRAVTTSYEIATVTAGVVVTASTKARTCDGPIAVSSVPGGATVQVIRANGTNIQGDRITVSSFVDAATGQAVGTVAGTPVSHIAAAHRSTQDSGAYRCYAFWTASETSAAGAWLSKSNYVDTAGTIGAQGNFIRHLGIGSRAFDHDGRIFVWGAFAGESSFSGASPSKFRASLQNTYFLYRDDATLHAKAAATRGGGLAPSVGRLPGVALTSGTAVYSWCATERRIISIGSSGEQRTFDKRAPRDVTFTFDSNNARRCARLGETLYVSGAEILQYDGVGLYEVGYHLFPWYFGIIEVAAGNLANGVYTYKVTWRWENAKGEMDRSSTATHGDVTIAAGPNGGSIVTWYPLYHTHKTTTKPISVEVWRTAVNPTDGVPFYLVTSKDPASATNPNRYIPNDPTATGLPTFNDELADSVATTKETNPENGDVLENLAPPGATIIAATDTRIFLAGVAGDPDRVWYSKLRNAGEVASFHDALTFDVPKDGGDITGIAFQNGLCVVFREYATYMFPGDGFDNTGRGQNYGPHQVVSPDVGCRDTDSIVVTPEGIAFQSSKGKYLLTRGWTMKPIGLQVTDYDSETVVAAHLMPAQHQVRWVTGSRVLVWDYLTDDKWAEWTLSSLVHAAIWQGTHHVLAAAGPYAEQTTYTGTSYGLDVETAWIKPNDLQGASEPLVLGEYRSTHYLRTRVAYDYKETWVDDDYWLAVPSTAGLPLQHQIPMSRRKMEAFKLRLTAVGTSTESSATTAADVPTLNPGGFWSATFSALEPGTQGDGITITIAVEVSAGATTVIEVRDHQKFTGATAAWTALADNVGIRVLVASTSTAVLMTAIEAAINSYSDLVDVSSSIGAPRLALVTIGTTTYTIGPTAGGAFASPTGESLKLTGLGLEVGVHPRLHRRYPRA
jgi:hypothetical protein